jgi:hypothetical protein
MLFPLCSCAGPKLSPPGPGKQTVLVLPVEVTVESQLARYGYYYIYEIADRDSLEIVHEAIIDLPLKGDMLIVDTLPPGDYMVRKFTFKPKGSGDFTYGKNFQQRHDKFKLRQGKITIFSKSLNVLLYNKIPGRGMETSYHVRMEPVTAAQNTNIRSTLKALPNFESWEISANE